MAEMKEEKRSEKGSFRRRILRKFCETLGFIGTVILVELLVTGKKIGHLIQRKVGACEGEARRWYHSLR